MSHVTSTQKLLLKSQMETNVSLTIPDLAQTTEKTFQLPSNQAITKYHAKTLTIWVINSLHTNKHFSSLRFDSLAPSLRLHQKSIIWSCNWQSYWFLTGRPTGTQRLLISLDYNLQGWGWKFTSKGCLPFDLLWSNKHKINEGPFIRREWALDKWTIWVQSYKQIYDCKLWL